MRYQLLSILAVVLFLFATCKKDFTPRPRGYFRISFPAKIYKTLELPLPYSFQVPVYATVGPDLLSPDQSNCVTIDVPANHAQIHLSYRLIEDNLGKFIEESHSLAYKHSQKASSIDEQVFINPSKRVYGTIYNIKGNAASPIQFYLTDSVRNFLRGSLYIKEIPNSDSLQPVIRFLTQDVLQLIKTTQWKKVK